MFRLWPVWWHWSDFLHLLIYDFLGFCCSRSELQPVPHKLHPNKEATTPAGCDTIWFSHLRHTKNPIHICLLLTNVRSGIFWRYSRTESGLTCFCFPKHGPDLGSKHQIKPLKLPLFHSNIYLYNSDGFQLFSSLLEHNGSCKSKINMSRNLPQCLTSNHWEEQKKIWCLNDACCGVTDLHVGLKDYRNTTEIFWYYKLQIVHLLRYNQPCSGSALQDMHRTNQLLRCATYL